jgi:hypothetical protein
MHAEYKLVICPQSYICNKNIIASSQEIISCSNARKTIHAIIDKKNSEFKITRMEKKYD